MASGSFSIDDAFESDEDEKIRVYGSTKDTAPLRKQAVCPRDVGDDDSTVVRVPLENDEASTSLIVKSNSKKSVGHRGPGAGSSHSLSGSWSEETTVCTRSVRDLRWPVSWYKHPKVRDNWKVVLGSFALTLMGLVLFVSGIAVAVISQASHSVVLFIAGVICLIPGVYHVVYIYCAVKGVTGFSLYNLHVFK